MLANAISRSMFAQTQRGELDNFWFRPVSGPVSAGVTVDDSSALSVATFWACLRVLSDTVGAMPWFVYHRTGEGKEQEDRKATDYPWYYVTHERPNMFQSPMDFKAMLVSHLMLRGNAYCRVVPGMGEYWYPQLIPLNPDKVEIEQTQSGSLIYFHKPTGKNEQEYRQDEIVHVKLIAPDGIVGLRPLEYAREVLGLNMAQVRHSASIYGGGGFFKYYLKTTKRMSKEAIDNFRAGWRDVHGDSGKFSPPILEDDMDMKTLGMSPEDTELLESRKFGAYEICQFCGVPPHLVFLLDRATFSNIEQQSIEFTTIHLNPWLVRIEQSLAPQLDDGYFSEFARDSIVRGDINSRYDAYSKALQGRPFMVPNDVRRKENMSPIDGWDNPADPLNMAAPGPRGQQTAAAVPVGDDDDDQASVPIDDARQTLIRMTASRLVTREVKALRARVGKAVENRGLYNAWATEWFAKQHAFVLGVLNSVDGAEYTKEDAASYCDRSIDELTMSADVSKCLDEWEKTKADRLAHMIEVSLCTTES